jgi:hypothetical protein
LKRERISQGRVWYPAPFLIMRCTTCLKVNKDESLQAARDEAKVMAVKDSIPVAIVEEGEDYVFYNAFIAYQNHLHVIEVISHL